MLPEDVPDPFLELDNDGDYWVTWYGRGLQPCRVFIMDGGYTLSFPGSRYVRDFGHESELIAKIREFLNAGTKEKT